MIILLLIVDTVEPIDKDEDEDRKGIGIENTCKHRLPTCIS